MKYRLKELAMLCWDEDESGFTFKREAYTSMFTQEFNTMPIGKCNYEKREITEVNTRQRQPWNISLILGWTQKTKHISRYCIDARKRTNLRLQEAA
jgi:hypothetical protein